MRMDVVTTIIAALVLFMCLYLFWCWFCFGTCIEFRQKTRNQQTSQRPIYGARTRPSLTQHEPTIFVGSSSYPPPPKYECMAPPSYEEVVGIHYPNYPPNQFPIMQPLSVALAQNTAVDRANAPAAVIATASQNDATSSNNDNVHQNNATEANNDVRVDIPTNTPSTDRIQTA